MTRTVSVTLATDIIYVSGTVNGTAYTWTQGVNGLWSAEVARAETDIYAVSLTAIDAAGNATTASTTIYYGLNLITDRVAGARYNASDLNRVGAAMSYVASRLRAAGVDISVTPKTGWTRADLPTQAAIDHYRAQLRAIYGAYCHLATTPTPPTDTDYLTVADANAIERILEDIDALLTLAEAAARCCGEIQCGEG